MLNSGNESGGILVQTKGQFPAFHKNNVRPAFFSQMVQGADTNNTAPNDNNACMRFHVPNSPSKQVRRQYQQTADRHSFIGASILKERKNSVFHPTFFAQNR